jgi:hypothetical protein
VWSPYGLSRKTGADPVNDPDKELKFQGSTPVSQSQPLMGYIASGPKASGPTANTKRVSGMLAPSNAQCLAVNTAAGPTSVPVHKRCPPRATRVGAAPRTQRKPPGAAVRAAAASQASRSAMREGHERSAVAGRPRGRRSSIHSRRRRVRYEQGRMLADDIAAARAACGPIEDVLTL